jgi:hypothetical protein
LADQAVAGIFESINDRFCCEFVTNGISPRAAFTDSVQGRVLCLALLIGENLFFGSHQFLAVVSVILMVID